MAKKRHHFSKKSKNHPDSKHTSWVRCELTCELLSDGHFGSGSGGAGIDALVARDHDDRPVIWASHVEGVLRDAARRLRGDKEAGQFFGRAGDKRQQAVFTSLYTTEAPTTHIWSSSAREAFDNRAPKDDTLRTVEYVPRGTRFRGRVELPKKQLKTLERLIQEVDALGRGRSSGSGRVKLSINQLQPEPHRHDLHDADRLVLLLQNLDPLCVTATATPDNLIPSLAFVPGRTLLGALAAWLIANGDRDVASILVDGKVKVSDALPLPQKPSDIKTAEVLPAPLSLQSTKPAGTAGTLPWWAQSPAAPERRDAWSEAAATKLKRPEDDLFVYRDDSDSPWITFRPARRVRLRNGRPNPRQPDASLFAIEQIVENTFFLCELSGAPEDVKRLSKKLKPILQKQRWLRVGRGGAPVEVSHVSPRPTSSTTQAPAKARLTLTSDLLVRDEFLRWCTAVDENNSTHVPGWPAKVQIHNSLQDSVMIHGFNGTSRLWRMPAAAIRRGSVFEVEGAGLQELMEMASKGEGLGERTNEGFGRFRLDETLPGITNPHAAAPPAPSSEIIDPLEKAAATTKEWLKAHASLRSSSSPIPSLSQWFGFVADLERNTTTPIDTRLSPSTRGAQTWAHPDARELLGKLKALAPEERAMYARLFVRWLRIHSPSPREVA